MQKNVYKKALVIMPMALLLLANAPVVYAEEDLFSQLKNGYVTQSNNYGKIGEENVDPGYQSFLNNVSTSTSIIDTQLKDLNEYKLNTELYNSMQTAYQDALTNQDDISKETLKKFEDAKATASADVNTEKNNQNTAFNNYSSQVANLKSELEKSKKSITSSAKSAATKRYSSSASQYSSAVAKVQAGMTGAPEAYNTLASGYQTSFEQAVKDFASRYKTDNKDLGTENETTTKTDAVKTSVLNTYKEPIGGWKLGG